MLGLDDVAVARYDIRVLGIGDAQQGFEPAQTAIGTPILGEFDRRTRQIAEFLELSLKPFEQRESVGRAAGEARKHLAVIEAAHLARVALHDGLTNRDLPVAADRYTAIAPYRKNRRAVDGFGIVIHRNLPIWGLETPFQALFKNAGARADGRRHKRSPNVGNPNACKSASCRCRHDRAAPGLRADCRSIRADALQTNGETCADAALCRCLAGAPIAPHAAVPRALPNGGRAAPETTPFLALRASSAAALARAPRAICAAPRPRTFLPERSGSCRPCRARARFDRRDRVRGH